MEAAKTQLMPDGAAIYYRIARAERPRGAIVLLHGMASNLTRWSEFVERTTLKRTWDIVRPDLRGHGESMVRGRIGMEIWSRDLVALLDAEGYAQAVCIGHSLGAHLALHFATRFPSRVRALVLIDPVFPQALRSYRRWLCRCRVLFAFAAAVVRCVNAFGVRRRAFPPRDLRALDEKVRVELLAAGDSREFVRRYSSALADLKYFPVSHYLQELHEMLRPLPPPAAVRLPILVLLSRGLTYADPAATERLLDTAANVERVTIDAFHWPLTERPLDVQCAVEAWFERQFPADVAR